MKPYPQMPPFTQEELVAFLNEAPVARLSFESRWDDPYRGSLFQI